MAKNARINVKNSSGTYDTLHPETNDTVVKITDTSDNFTSETLDGVLNELFTNASNGKKAIATALTGIGVASSGDETFDSLSDKITNLPKVGTIEYANFEGNVLDVTGTIDEKIKDLVIKSKTSIGSLKNNGKFEIGIKLTNGISSTDKRFKSYTKLLELPKPLLGSKLLNKYNEVHFNEIENKIEFVQNLDEGSSINEVNDIRIPSAFKLNQTSIDVYKNKIIYQRGNSSYLLVAYDTVTKTSSSQYSSLGVYNYGIYVYNDELYHLTGNGIYKINPNNLSSYTKLATFSDLDASVISEDGVIYFCELNYPTTLTSYDLNTNLTKIEDFNKSKNYRVYLKGVYKNKLYLTIDDILNVYDINTKLLTIDSLISLTSTEAINTIKNNLIYINNSSNIKSRDRIYDIDLKISTSAILTSKASVFNNSELVVLNGKYYSVSTCTLQQVDIETGEIINSEGYARNEDYDNSLTAAGDYMYANNHNSYYQEMFCLSTGKHAKIINNPSYMAKFTTSYKNYMIFKSYDSYDGYDLIVFLPLTQQFVEANEGSTYNSYIGFAKDSIVICSLNTVKIWSFISKMVYKTYTTSSQLFNSNNNVTVSDRYIYYTVNSKMYKMDVETSTIEELGITAYSFNGRNTINYNNEYILIFSYSSVAKYDIEKNEWTNELLPSNHNLGYYIGAIGEDLFFSHSSYSGDISIYNILTNTVRHFTLATAGYSLIYKNRLYTAISYSGSWFVQSVKIEGGTDVLEEPVITQLDEECNWNSYKHRTTIELLNSDSTASINANLKIEQ